MMSGNKWVLIVLPLCILLSTGVTAKLTDEEISQLPRLFHLDDYNKCLSRSDGVYCLGTFQLAPLKEPHPVYNLMKKHSEHRYNFNRTHIHRGYCLNNRCPSTETNNSLRFEKCGDFLAQKHGMRATIRKLDYCRTHEEASTVTPPSYEQTLFIQVLYALLAFNVIGTVYDVMTGDALDKNKLLVAWSVPANWKRLMHIPEISDPRFEALVPIQGARVVAMFLIMYAHARVFHYPMFIHNPEALEKLTTSNEGVLLSNGSLLTHGFVMLTSFLTSYQFLIYSQKQPLGLHMLPMCIIKRIIRITPVHVFLVGYAATWWDTARDGPLISSTLGEYTSVCRRKFWTHLFYVNNIVDKDYPCLLPTWYLAVDMHLYILACMLSLIMWQYRRQALPLYSVCLIVSLILNSVICYTNGWISTVLVSTSENLKILFAGKESFTRFYSSTWGALPACFLGLLMGHAYFELQEKGIKLSEYKLFVVLHTLAVPLGVMWQTTAGKYATTQTSMAFAATFITVDRIALFILLVVYLGGLVTIDGLQSRFYKWGGWEILARLSLSVMLLHWMVNLVIAARPTVYSISTLDGMVDWAATVVISYALAIPVTLLVEIPTRRFFNALL